ncbi:hypothetical protein T02_8279 [Trichinella nativa]|uniref:Uncharacterized protein n=1 Tax=Trichinella nativa TaxID=6335 RepID=A0A0V1L9Z8_9BILA|nr:hypothetical protein T02_8279 [Trichinella nativa]
MIFCANSRLTSLLMNFASATEYQRTHDRSVTETAIKGGVRGVHPPRMSVKRPSEVLPQRFLDRADEALPVASHPRGSLRDEFPVNAVAYQLTLDSVHVHVSPELPQLGRSGFERAKIIRLDDLRSSSPGDEPSERLHHSGRRHLWDQFQMHCPGCHARKQAHIALGSGFFSDTNEQWPREIHPSVGESSGFDHSTGWQGRHSRLNQSGHCTPTSKTVLDYFLHLGAPFKHPMLLS